MRYELNNETMNNVNGGAIVKMMPRHKTHGKTVYYAVRDDKGNGFEIRCKDLEAALLAAQKYGVSSEVTEVRY